MVTIVMKVGVEVALIVGIVEIVSTELVKVGGESLVADRTTATTTLLVATTLMLLKSAASSAARELLATSCRL